MASLSRARVFYSGDSSVFARRVIRHRLRLLQRAIERELAELAAEPAPRA